MEAEEKDVPPTSTSSPITGGAPPMLSWWSFLACLAILLGIFLGLHPIWEPLDMAAMDSNIIWSYLPAPLLVAIFLALERKLRPSSLVLETLRLTLVKFGLTFAVTHALWTVSPPPGASRPAVAPMSARTVADAYAPRAAPAPTPLEPGSTGELAGRVVDGAGRPLGGVLVQVSDGLGRLVFAPPDHAVVARNDGAGFVPDSPIVQAWQPLELRTADGSLHTARATDAMGRLLFNYPAIPSGGRSVTFERGHGLVTLACTVHGDAEAPTHILVVAHPFAAPTDEDGRFLFTGVPAGEVEVSAWDVEGRAVTGRAAVRPGARADVQLVEP